MNEAYLQRLKRIEPYAVLWRDDNKFIELRAGLYATLYFKHFHPMVDTNDAIREALIECWQDYWQVIGKEHQRRTYNFSPSIKDYKLPTTKVPLIYEYLRDPENFGSYQYYVYGGDNKDDASEYLFSLAAFPVYGAPEYPMELGYLRLQAPLDYITAGRLGEFVSIVKRCATRLKVDQAHGGLGFLRTYNHENSTRYMEAQLSKVFSGVDIDVPYVQMGDIFSNNKGGHLGIDSPHWLNFIHDHWVEKLGGIEAIRQRLPEDTFTVEPYDGGLFIQAGAYPEPGHKDDGLPSAYIWLNRVLKPVRVPDMGYHMGGEPGQLGLSEDAMPYFTRFDAASEQLPPLDTAEPIIRQRCDAGQPCPREGYWHSPAKADSRRYFKQGDLMPDLDSNWGLTIWQRDENQDG